MKTAQEASDKLSNALIPHLDNESVKQLEIISGLIDKEVDRLIEARKQSNITETHGYVEISFHPTKSVADDLKSFGYEIVDIPYPKSMGSDESIMYRIKWN